MKLRKRKTLEISAKKTIQAHFYPPSLSNKCLPGGKGSKRQFWAFPPVLFALFLIIMTPNGIME
jgi:hypothetical protein